MDVRVWSDRHWSFWRCGAGSVGVLRLEWRGICGACRFVPCKGFQAKVDWISVLTGPEKDWKRSVIYNYSPNFIILPIFGPNRGSLRPTWRTRSQSKRETSLEERSGGSVFAVFLFDRFVRTCDLSFSGLVATLRTKLFPATTKYHYCSESFPIRPSRDENQ